MAKRGETKEKIIVAATKVFFQNGYEATSIKMILEEAQIVTGSFYHFFASKEALFECVVDNFLKKYASTVCSIFYDSTLNLMEVFEKFFLHLEESMKVYYQILQADKLHWTVQYALHVKTIDTLVEPIKNLLTRQIESKKIKPKLSVDNQILAKILIHGTEAIIHSGKQITDCGDIGLVKTQIMEFLQTILEIEIAN